MSDTHKRDIIVVGASLGGMEALKTLFAGFPSGLDAAVLVVWHMAPEAPGLLPAILQRGSEFPIAEAADGETLRTGRAYIARPDYHLLVEAAPVEAASTRDGIGTVRLSRGPKENRFRPSVDVLFRSAAVAFGARVIGVVLTGALDDGASGLYAIKKCGGAALVQDPLDAQCPNMPINAMRAVEVDRTATLAEMPRVLAELVNKPLAENRPVTEGETMDRWQAEVDIAREDGGLERGVTQMGPPSVYTCPECHGVLMQIEEGKRVRFRCHTGHAFSADALLAEITKHSEEALWNALRAIEEIELLLGHMSAHLREAGEESAAEEFSHHARLTKLRADFVRQAVLQNEVLSEEKLGGVAPAAISRTVE